MAGPPPAAAKPTAVAGGPLAVRERAYMMGSMRHALVSARPTGAPGAFVAGRSTCWAVLAGDLSQLRHSLLKIRRESPGRSRLAPSAAAAAAPSPLAA